MRSLFYTGFERRFERHRLGQLDFLPGLISAGVSAAATFYSAHMQKLIAEQQKRTQEELQAKQQAAADATAKAQAAAAQAAAQGAQGPAGTPGAPGAPGAPNTILGLDRNVVIFGGIAALLVFGGVAFVVSKSGTKTGNKK